MKPAASCEALEIMNFEEELARQVGNFSVEKKKFTKKHMLCILTIYFVI